VVLGSQIKKNFNQGKTAEQRKKNRKEMTKQQELPKKRSSRENTAKIDRTSGQTYRHRGGQRVVLGMRARGGRGFNVTMVVEKTSWWRGASPS